MEVPKNFPVPESSALDWVQRLLKFQLPPSVPVVIRFETWNIGIVEADDQPGLAKLWAVGVGLPTVSVFDPPSREATIRWLMSDTSNWLEHIPRAVPARSDGTQHPELPPNDEAIRSSLAELLSVAGDLGMSIETVLKGEAVRVIDISLLASRLYSLRSVLQLVAQVFVVDKPAEFYADAQRALMAADPELAAAFRTLGDDEAGGLLVRRFLIVAKMGWLLDGRLVEASVINGPWGVGSGPVSPLFEIWLVAAVSIGAVIPPYPLPGVFQCAYHLCRKVFVSTRTGVVGKLRFCCIDHGKNFYAARRMKEKSKKARIQAQPEE